jgi:hypothetical protein
LYLPNPARAIVDIAKLRDYCLNSRHVYGGHKARVFAAVGVTAHDAGWLRSVLLEIVHSEAKHVGCDRHGETYSIDFELQMPSRTVTVRSGWIVPRDEQFPRLTTCFVLKKP